MEEAAARMCEMGYAVVSQKTAENAGTCSRIRIISVLVTFLRSVKGYTRLDKIRSYVIRKELGISGIQDVRSKHKQNWINQLERMDNTRLQKHALNYKPRGRRDRGRPRKRWQRFDAGTGQTI